MKPKLRFEPTSFSWVALHPQPKGVLQFIGGAFFGSLPTLFYRYLLRRLFEAGYTLIVFPFRFSFRHNSIALTLLTEQQTLRSKLTEMAIAKGYDHELYQQQSSYTWIGHSLGCKYIALLELMSGQEVLAKLGSPFGASQGIFNQPSLLIAPNISDTESAVPIKSLARLLDRLGLGAKPTRAQTKLMIQQSRLFHLTAMISFRHDSIAGSIQDLPEDSDVRWLFEQLPDLIHAEIPGKHLEPIGVQIDRNIVDLNPLDKFIKPLSQRQLEPIVLQMIEQLQERLNRSTIQPNPPAMISRSLAH